MSVASPFQGPFEGSELIDDGLDMLPTCAGVYIWRRSLTRDPDAARDIQSLIGWLTRGVQAPLVSIDNLESRTESASTSVGVRSGFLRIGSVVVGGGDWSPSKLEELATFLADPTRRTLVASLFVSAGGLFGPILYVGEAGSLRGRVGQHLRGETPLLERIRCLGTTLDDLHLWVLPLPEPQFKKSERQLIEQGLTHFLVSPLVLRPG